ncbi:metal ABC transporter substrate-binding protein [Sporomusa malonica]|uniref:Zinc transport system substrate-binding protein n=1 Tax=Sporomusa malonica TaxID=112901 RepID=A0A1W1YAC3_9FIRM|nr:metal ABC transporter substrate-binding protein [Sporomusa malonica]SMC32698.1 zinc transport system substrate-binding protein [Sporomusa malonica]
MNRIAKMGLVFLLCAALLVTLAGCGNKTKSTQAAPDKLKVFATVYPVYDFARQVGGDKIELAMLMPPGAEPHDWEPTAQDIVKIKSAKLVLYHGAGLEPVDKLLSKDVLATVKAVEVSKGIPLLANHENDEDEDEDSHHQHDKEKKPDQHKHESETDTHVWLDPVNAQQEVKAIAEALSEVDPPNKDYYQKNAERFIQELAKLDSDYQTTLAKAARHDIITSHIAFGYLAKRYNLEQIGIMGLAPDSEPTPDKMAKVVDFCRTHQVKYIFFETLVSPKLADTIAKETGAGLLVLNPLENLTAEEIKQGKNYVSVMRENLSNLDKALQK